MAIRRKEFQKLVGLVKDFLAKLPSSEITAELRDSLNLSLLHMHRYYKRVQLQAHTSTAVALEPSLSLVGSWNGAVSPISPHLTQAEKFDWRWMSLDASKLCASFGHGDKNNFVPEIFYIIKDCNNDELIKVIQEDPDVVNETDALGRTTAMYALHGATRDHLKCLRTLVENGVDLNHQANDGTTSLHVAAHSRNQELIEEVLRHEVDVNAEDHRGHTALHWACMYPEASIVQLLLDSGASCIHTDSDGLNPLMWACYFDQIDNLECLLTNLKENEGSYNPALVLKDANGRSLIHWSVSRPANTECVKYLLNPETALQVDVDGKSVFMVAAENGCVHGCEEVLSLCGNSVIDEVDNCGRTALHLACISGHGEVVDLLLNRGASQCVTDSKGLTPLDYIKSRQLSYCSLVFLSYQVYNDKLAAKAEVHVNHESYTFVDGDSHVVDAGKETWGADVDEMEGFEIQREGYEESTTGKSNLVISESLERQADVHAQNNAMVKGMVDKPGTTKKDTNEPQLEYNEVMDFTLVDEEEKPAIVDPAVGDNGTVNEANVAHNSLPVAEEKLESPNEPIDFEFEDQLVVLVEHHGSEDEGVVFQYGDELQDQYNDVIDNVVGPTEIDVNGTTHLRSDVEQEVLDTSHTPRLPTVTGTATSEPSAAVVSASANFSITSLGSDSEEEIEGREEPLRPNKGPEVARPKTAPHRTNVNEDVLDVSHDLSLLRPASADGKRGGHSAGIKHYNDNKGSQIPIRAPRDGSSSPSGGAPKEKSAIGSTYFGLSTSPKSGSLGPLEPLRPLQSVPAHGKSNKGSLPKASYEHEIIHGDLNKNNSERKSSSGFTGSPLLGRRDSSGSQIPRPVSPLSQRRSLPGGNVSHLPKPPTGK